MSTRLTVGRPQEGRRRWDPLPTCHPINPPSIHNFYGPVNYVIVGNATGTFSSVACPMCGVGKASKAGSTAR